MAKVEPGDLISILKVQNRDEYKIIEQKKMISQFSEKEIEIKYESILSVVNTYKDASLKRGVYLALLGALYAFLDRDLNPLEENHIQLFGVIQKDMEQVYEEISDQFVDEETWQFEAFDYGIKHVYYLDWQLYLSQICY